MNNKHNNTIKQFDELLQKQKIRRKKEKFWLSFIDISVWVFMFIVFVLPNLINTNDISLFESNQIWWVAGFVILEIVLYIFHRISKSRYEKEKNRYLVKT